MFNGRYVVCLCGSTKFSEEYREARIKFTLDGYIVLTIGCDIRSDDDIFGHLTLAQQEKIKKELDELHLDKVRMADRVYIINKGGYIGFSTRRELALALKMKKSINWLEPDKEPSQEILDQWARESTDSTNINFDLRNRWSFT